MISFSFNIAFIEFTLCQALLWVLYNYSVQFSLVAQSCPTLCNPMNCSIPGFPVHHQLPELLKLISSKLGCHPAISSSVVPFSSCRQSFPASGSFPLSQLFAPGGQNTGVSASTSVEQQPSGLISFRMDWLDLLAVQETLKSLLQHHSSKASILWRSAFFTVQLSWPLKTNSHDHITTGKTIALTRRTFVGKVISLLFNMLSRLVITFLPRSKCLFISWLQSPSAVILQPSNIKSASVSTFST